MTPVLDFLLVPTHLSSPRSDYDIHFGRTNASSSTFSWRGVLSWPTVPNRTPPTSLLSWMDWHCCVSVAYFTRSICRHCWGARFDLEQHPVLQNCCFSLIAEQCPSMLLQRILCGKMFGNTILLWKLPPAEGLCLNMFLKKFLRKVNVWFIEPSVLLITLVSKLMLKREIETNQKHCKWSW